MRCEVSWHDGSDNNSRSDISSSTSQQHFAFPAEGSVFSDIGASHSHRDGTPVIEVQLPSGVQLRIPGGIESLETILVALQRSVA